MERTGLIVALAVALCISAHAVTYGNANLEGNYAFALSRADWACMRVNSAGQCEAKGTAERGILGEITFDGSGSFSGSYWAVHQSRGATWTTRTENMTGTYLVVAPGLAQSNMSWNVGPTRRQVIVFI
jgi:hypothetical protein